MNYLIVHYSFCLCSADCRTQLSTFEMEDQKLSDNSFELIIAYHAMAVHCDKKHHFLTVPYILFKILTLLHCFIENFHEGILHCRRIATVKRIWVHNILLVEAVDHCSAHCSPAIPPLPLLTFLSVTFRFHLQKLFEGEGYVKVMLLKNQDFQYWS